jgi:hypothetical protein
MVVLPWFLPYFDDYTAEPAQARAAYRKMFADPNVKSALLGKLLAVGALDLKIRPAEKKNPLDEEVAEFVKWTLTERIRDGFPGLVWSILSGGLVDGYSVCEKVFEQEEGGDFDKLWPLVAVKPKDVGNDLVLQTDSYRNVVSVMGLRYNAGQYFSPARFLIWRHLPLYDTPTGMSDLRAVYSRYWLLDTVLKLRGVNAEKRAIPFLMGTYQNPSQQRSLENTLALVKSQSWVTVPEGVKVEALNIAGSSDAIFEGFIRDLKHDIFMGIQGAILQALEGSVTDGRGNSQVHRSTADLLVWYLAQSLQTLLNDRTNGLIKDIVDLNYVVNRYPRATLSAVDVGEMTAELDIDTKLHAMGVELSKEDMYERYNRVPPLSPLDALKKDGGGMPGMPGPGGPGGGGLPPGGPPGLGGPDDPMGGDEDLDGEEVDDDGLFDEQDLFTAPMRRFAEWDESKHPRGKGGRFGRGSSGAQAKKKAKRNAARREAGGGSVDHTSGPSPRKSLLRVAGSQVMSTIRKAKHKVEDVEHVVADYLSHGVDRQIERLPPGTRQGVAATWWLTKLGTKAAFIAYTTGQRMAEKAAKESGATPEQAARIRAVCTAVDLAGAKIVPLALGAVGLGAIGVPASFVIPAGSAAYLAYSKTKRALAVLRAARNVVKGMAETLLSKFGEVDEDTLKLALIYLAGELARGSITQEEYDQAVEMLTDNPEEFAEEDWKRLPDGPRGGKRWESPTGRVVHSKENPGKGKAPAKKAADKPAKEKPAAKSTDGGLNLARLVHTIAGKSDVGELAGILGGLHNDDLQGLKKEWKLKVGGTKAAQAKALAKHVLDAVRALADGEEKPDPVKKPAPQKKPASKPEATAKGEPSPSANAIVTAYNRAGDIAIPQEKYVAMLAPLDTMGKPELVQAAEKMGVAAPSRLSAAKLRDTLKDMALRRRGGSQRAQLINRPEPAAEVTPEEQPAAKKEGAR